MTNMRRSPFLVSLLAGLGAIVTVSPAWGGKVKETTRYFAVHGSTLTELDNSLSRSGPMIEETGQRHPGATSVKFDGHVTYKPITRGCEVSSVDINLTLGVTLPKWVRPRRVESRTALIWQTLEKDITRHEKEHAKIAVSYLKRLESALKNLRPERNCQAMERTANKVMARYLSEHERAQIEFDTIEGRDVDLRLRQALRRTLSEEASR